MPKRHHRLRWTFVSFGSLLVLVLITAGWLTYQAISVVNTQKNGGGKLSFFQQLSHIITSNDQELQGETDGRITILLEGIGGPGHEGPYLTDTLMVASIRPATKEVALLSIPRDLVVNIPGYDYRKINNVLSIGRDKKYPGGGDALVVKIVGDLLDLPIPYYLRVDFSGFREVVDRLGGVTVTVDNAFTDYEYPDNNYGYETIRFKTGEQAMDGSTALKFSRSRHGNNGEGSDFARAARQQKIIVATKEKALSLGTLINPKKISDILGSLGSHSQTNMEVWEILRLAKMVGAIPSQAIVTRVLDNSATGLLHNSTGQNGAYILEPNDPTYGDIQFLANNLFLVGEAAKEGARILVANATALTGLADKVSKSLQGLGLALASPLSLRDTTIGQTLLLDNSSGRFPKTMALLGLYAKAQGTVSLSTWVSQTEDQTLAAKLQRTVTGQNTNVSNTNSTDRGVDAVLILGQDQPKAQKVTAAR